MAKLPKGYSKAFAKAKAMGKDTFTLDGKTYRTSGGRTHGKSMEELRGEKKAEKAKAGASNPPTQENTKKLTRPKPRPKPTRPKARPDRGPSVSDGPSMSSPSTESTSGVVSRRTETTAQRSTPKRLSDSKPDRGVDTKQSRYKDPVRKEDLKGMSDWMKLTREQRKQIGLKNQVQAQMYFATRK